MDVFSEFADSMKQVVTDSSAQRPTKRALVALKLPSRLLTISGSMRRATWSTGEV